MIRAEFNFTDNGIKAVGYFSCNVTNLEKRAFVPVECFFTSLIFKTKDYIKDLEKLKEKCWAESVAQIY